MNLRWRLFTKYLALIVGLVSFALFASGLALGLYIVDQIIRAHGGEVKVYSDETHGTTFHIRLPRRPKKDTGHPSGPADQHHN